MSYAITQSLLPMPSKRRSGLRMPSIKFLVAHDTGNPKSTARNNVNFYTRTAHDVEASAHLFVDDKEIIECVPAFVNPEKAWHVWRSTTVDNEMFGVNANDCAIGVEYCYGDNINADEAYKRYVWILAKLCVDNNLDPMRHIVGHYFLDPKRKTDPVTGLAHSRRTYDQLLKDVEHEVAVQNNNAPTPPLTQMAKSLTTVGCVNVREGRPSTLVNASRVLEKGTVVPITGFTLSGQAVNGNSKWYQISPTEWVWSGGLI